MNCWNIHPIPQIWLPLTSISSQNSNSSLLVSIFLQIKRWLQLLRGILQILWRTTTGTGQWRWSIAGINVLVLSRLCWKIKIILKLYVRFFIVRPITFQTTLLTSVCDGTRQKILSANLCCLGKTMTFTILIPWSPWKTSCAVWSEPLTDTPRHITSHKVILCWQTKIKSNDRKYQA